ncbi:MAG TPA: hypothetical protein VNQ56_03440 [Pseudolabrys sp.]|nr:hypothetical protein [Pseudolabrys sp.]
MNPKRTVAMAFVAGMLGYVVLSYLAFKVPTSAAEAELCGFIDQDFSASGQFLHAPLDAWWISFTRLQEYWTSISVGLAVAFIAFALSVGRRAGGTTAAGGAIGGGALALSALCVSCLAPVLSVVGLGIVGTLLAGVPKWLITVNILLLTGWGMLFLSRRANACALPSQPRPSAITAS